MEEFKILLSNEKIFVVHKSSILEYSIYKPDSRKDGLFISMSLKSGNIIHGFVKNSDIEFFIEKLESNSIYKLYIKQYTSGLVCIKLLDMYSTNRKNLIDYIR